MSSGLYAALSGAVAKMQSLDVTTNNLSNAGTPGYKKDDAGFEALYQGALQNGAGKGLNFVRMYRNFTDFSQAELSTTGNPLDVAIQGPGFFKLQGPDGYVYTRTGKFRLDGDNVLVNGAGLPVMGDNGGSIVIEDPQSLQIDQDGRVRDANGAVGRLPVFNVDDPAALEKLGGGLYAAPGNAGERQVPDARLLQSHLENSNVEPLQEMTRMIDDLRAFEAYQKVLKTFSKLSGQAQKLGSIG